jgi:DNA ligase-1
METVRNFLSSQKERRGMVERVSVISARLLLSLVVWFGLVLGAYAPLVVAEDTAPVAAAPTAQPALMLANVYAEGVDLSAYWVSEKLDGVRAYWDGARLISRGGHPIHAPDWFTAGFPKVPLDGELWMGRGTFERLSGTVRREEPDSDAWRAVRYMVFDMPGVDQPFGHRLQMMQKVLAASASPYIALIRQFRVADHAALMARLDAVVRAGGEGLMLHRDAALYRAGRSDDLLKVKPYLDAEARVIAHLPGQGKYAGMLGSLLIEDANGRRFRLGTGFTDEERRHPPAVGSVVTFKYHGYTDNGVPRFASFLRVREPE